MNTLTINWKALLGKQEIPCGNPQSEGFHNVKNIEAAQEILDRRNRDNISVAVWNGITLIHPTKKIKAVKKMELPVDIPIQKKSVFHKFSLKSVSANIQRIFSRQKH